VLLTWPSEAEASGSHQTPVTRGQSSEGLGVGEGSGRERGATPLEEPLLESPFEEGLVIKSYETRNLDSAPKEAVVAVEDRSLVDLRILWGNTSGSSSQVARQFAARASCVIASMRVGCRATRPSDAAILGGTSARRGQGGLIGATLRVLIAVALAAKTCRAFSIVSPPRCSDGNVLLSPAQYRLASAAPAGGQRRGGGVLSLRCKDKYEGEGPAEPILVLTSVQYALEPCF
jgi:hypothetical protein